MNFMMENSNTALKKLLKEMEDGFTTVRQWNGRERSSQEKVLTSMLTVSFTKENGRKTR